MKNVLSNVFNRSAHRLVLGFLFVGAGVLHFVVPDFYLRIMPPFFPAPRFLVYASGGLELLGGLGLLTPRLFRPAAGGLALLLVAFFPVHVYMLVNPAAVNAGSVSPLLLWLRLGFQFVLIAWVLWSAGLLRESLRRGLERR